VSGEAKVWDVLFGTYYRPAADEYPHTGVIGEPSDPDNWEIIVGPLRSWIRNLRRDGKGNQKQAT